MDENKLMRLFTEEFLRDQIVKRLPHDAVVYLVSARMPNDGGLLVKVGMTEAPFRRYCTLLTGIPLPSEMFWSPAASRKRAYRVESTIHQLLSHFHSAREWFFFPTHEAVETLRSTVAAVFWDEFGHFPYWSRIFEEDATREIARLRLLAPRKVSPKQSRLETRSPFRNF